MIKLELINDEDTYVEDPYAKVAEYFRTRIFLNALQWVMNDGTIKPPVEIAMDTPLEQVISLQIYYSTITNKCYMEYNLPPLLRQICNIEDLKKTIAGFTNANMHYDIGYWPEIVVIEDGVNEKCNNTPILTPYTVGYWMSLASKYEFLEDKALIDADLRQFKVVDHGEEYNKKYKNIYNSYYRTNFELFNQKIQELNLEYKINPDEKPSKKFEDFITTVSDIRKKYEQVQLTEEQKLAYIKEYNEIYLEYHDDEVTYKAKIKELNNKYNYVSNIDQRVPEIYTEYCAAYKDFFGRDLPDSYIQAQKYRFKLIYDIPEEEEEDTLEE